MGSRPISIGPSWPPRSTGCVVCPRRALSSVDFPFLKRPMMINRNSSDSRFPRVVARLSAVVRISSDFAISTKPSMAESPCDFASATLCSM